MEITKKTDYALRALKVIAKSSETIVNAKTISEKENIPMPFLIKILRELTKVNIIRVHRGVTGGYSFTQNSEELSLYDVVYLFEGEYSLSRKIDTSDCPLKQELCRIDEVTRDELKRKPLIQLF